MSGIGGFAGIQAQVGDALRTGADTATMYAERILDKLDGIREAVTTRPAERAFATTVLTPGQSRRIIEGRSGYLLTIEQISIVTDGAVDVDIHVGSEGAEGFRSRLSTAAAGRANGPLTGFAVPEESPVFAIATGAGARVNMQYKRERIAPIR